VDLGLSSGVSGVSSGVSSIGRGKGVTKGLSSALVGAPLSMVTYSNGLRVTLSSSSDPSMADGGSPLFGIEFSTTFSSKILSNSLSNEVLYYKGV
jgi:hypothetical protein